MSGKKTVLGPEFGLTGLVALGLQEQLVKLFLSHGRKVIVIAGPTGVGKTAFSLRLAEALGGEIVSADSMHLYRGMDIGTAKVSEAERLKIPHHLIDVYDISEECNLFEYCAKAKVVLEEIMSRRAIPIVVGGTGFYVHGLMYGPPNGPPTDPAVRERIEKEMELLGREVLFDSLKAFDPAYASTISKNDKHKIVRALEIIELAGRRVSEYSWKLRKPIPFYHFRCWFLDTPRPILYERLEARCHEMLADGFLEEVIRLEKAGLRSNRSTSQAVGYRQALEFLDGERTSEDYDRFVERFVRASCHLAKRQWTWFRREPFFQWVDVSSVSQEALLGRVASDFFESKGA